MNEKALWRLWQIQAELHDRVLSEIDHAMFNALKECIEGVKQAEARALNSLKESLVRWEGLMKDE